MILRSSPSFCRSLNSNLPDIQAALHFDTGLEGMLLSVLRFSNCEEIAEVKNFQCIHVLKAIEKCIAQKLTVFDSEVCLAVYFSGCKNPCCDR